MGTTSSITNDADTTDYRSGEVLTPPRHSPIQILNCNEDDHDDANGNSDKSFSTLNGDVVPRTPTRDAPSILKVSSTTSFSGEKNNFKTPSPTKNHMHRQSAATTSSKIYHQQTIIYNDTQSRRDLLLCSNDGGDNMDITSTSSAYGKARSSETTQASILTTPTKNLIKNPIGDERALRRQTQSAPNRSRKLSSRRKNLRTPNLRSNKQVANYRKSMLSQSLSVQQRYRKKLEREAREKVSRTRTQEKRDKRYHFSLNAWQQIDRKEWEKNPKSYFKKKQSVIKSLIKRYGVPSPYRYHVWKLLIGNDAHITKELFNVFSQRAMEVSKAEEEKGKLFNHLHIGANDSNGSNINNSSTGGSLDKNAVATRTIKDEKNMYGKETSVLSISVDLNRTFPKLAFFRHDGSHHKPLKRVLAAYCFYRPDCGYVQGMSFLAAMILLQMGIEDPYETFVLLVNIMGRDDGKLLKFYKLNSQENKGVYDTFNNVLSTKLPHVYKHLKNVGVTPDMYLLPWWMTIFSKYLGLDLAVRVWDGFMVFGTSYLTQVALGILHVCQNEILNGDFGTCLKICLRNLPSSITEDMLFDSIETMG
eukprot:g5664.t1